MRKATIQTTLANGGRIQNHSLVNKDGSVHQGKSSKVTEAQIQSLVDADEVIEHVGYDRTRTYRQS